MISNNSDFLFIYEAIQCNPNGDPDQENKPRMDYDTNTNLVTDTRVKRYIRDFLKQEGKEIFVDMEGTSKVSVDTRLINVISKYLDSPSFDKIQSNNKCKKLWNDLRNQVEFENVENNEDYWKKAMELYRLPAKKVIQSDKPKKKIIEKELSQLNDELLFLITKNEFIDMRLFGSAVAVSGFPRSITGSIQLNWGYSLNKVYLMDSNTIVTIMNDGNSTFGKDYRVKYSLLAFHGTINKFAAETTGMNDNDRIAFRKAIWQSLTTNPTRTKLNQYPKLYLEIVYNEGFHNGFFGDLRSHISTKPKQGIEDREVRGLNDLDVSVKDLIADLKTQTGEGKAIKEVIIKTSLDFQKILD